MEAFKKHLEADNVEAIRDLLKSSTSDLLKSIAKRYRLSVTTKKKELIISDIVECIQQGKPFGKEPDLHVMTLAQLKNKARQLQLNVSSLKSKPAFLQAILDKMQQSATGTWHGGVEETKESGLPVSPPSSSPVPTISDLEKKSLTELKVLAKLYKIKVSKLGKSQIITLIIEKMSAGEPVLTVDLGEASTADEASLKKLMKNVLLLKAKELGVTLVGKEKKEDLIRLILAKTGGGEAVVATATVPVATKPSVVTSEKQTGKPKKAAPTNLNQTLALPISKELAQAFIKDKGVTVNAVKSLLEKKGLSLPKKVGIKRNDVINYLTKIGTGAPAVAPAPPVVATEKAAEIIAASAGKETAPAVQAKPTETKKKKPSPPHIETEAEFVELEDINTPFSPVDLDTLLDEPSDKQIRDELFRCLEFYEPIGAK